MCCSIVVLLMTFVPQTVQAQSWLNGRQAEGHGIKLGDFELHPGVGVELGYDSNLFFVSDAVASGSGLPQRIDTAILRVTPHLLFSTQGAKREADAEQASEDQPVASFRGGVMLSYYEFFASEKHRNLSIDVPLSLTILPGRTFSVVLSNNFNRTIRPFVDNLAEVSYAKIHDDASVDFILQTPGETLKFALGYRFAFDFYEDQSFRYVNNFNHTVRLTEAFKFLPNTSLVHETELSFRNYPNGKSTDPTYLSDSITISTRGGLNGALTNEISLSLLLGYTASDFKALGGYDQDFDSINALADLRWKPSSNVMFGLGYSRDMQQSLIGNYFSRDRGYITSNLTLNHNIFFALTADVSYLDFGRMIRPDGSMLGNKSEREDIRAGASLFGEYRFTDWFAVNGTAIYQGTFTDFQFALDSGVLDPVDFNKFEAWLGLRIFL